MLKGLLAFFKGKENRKAGKTFSKGGFSGFL